MKSGWIDIATNTISQNEASAQLIMEHFLSDDRLPSKYFPLFLHEFTHHWCFNSLVGFSISLLCERARGLIASGDVSSEVTQRLLWDTVFRYNVTIRLLCPLIEGIALFAEFDSLLGQSKSISCPSEWCGKLFRPPEIRPFSLLDDWRPFIQSWRASDDGIARKALLLSAPLGRMSRGDYLPGYLCFRVLHRQASKRSDQLIEDSDFFVTYARHLFFNDARLAALLIEKPMDHSTWTECFLTRLSDRMAWLSDGQDSKVLDEFDESIANGLYDSRKHAHLLDLTEIDVCDWETAVNRWKSDPTEGLAGASWLSFWRRQLPILILYRSVVRLARSPAMVRIGNTNHVFADGHDLGPKNMDVIVGTEEAAGSVTLYFIPEATSLLMVVERAGKLIRIGVPSSLQQDRLAVPKITSVKAFHAMQTNGLYGKDDAVQMSEMVEWFQGLSESVASVTQLASRYWNDRALEEVDTTRREALVAKMNAAGFGQLLDRDRFLLDGLSTISAFSACKCSFDELSAHFNGKGVDVNSVVAGLADIEKKCGLKLLVTEPDAGPPHRLRCLV